MKESFRLLADQNLFSLDKLCQSWGFEFETFDPMDGFEGVLNASHDGVLLRTVSAVNEETFLNSHAVKAIFTASAGTDHIDTQLLQQKGIAFGHAKGSNADAVAEYVVVSLLYLCAIEGRALDSLKVGIVGVGAVGSALARKLHAMSVHLALYDPPRQQRASDFISCDVDELRNCDVLSFHVPLIKHGAWKTHHIFKDHPLWEDNRLAVIQASRGGVLDEALLIEAKQSGRLRHLVLDVWENEPLINAQSYAHCTLATPHIAGYSAEAKLRAVYMAMDFFNRIKKEPLTKSPTFEALAQILLAPQRLEYNNNEDWDIKEFLRHLHPLFRYAQAMQAVFECNNGRIHAADFQQLRVQQQLSRELAYIKIDAELITRFPFVRVLQGIGI